MTDLANATLELACLAGEVANGYFRAHVDPAVGNALAARAKSDGSLVSEADVATELAARQWLARRFPGDAILGEEEGGAIDPDRRTWLIDPIDGTTSFLAGVPLFATLIATIEGDEVTAGAACFPALGQSIAAARGGPLLTVGVRAGVSAVDRLEDALVLCTDPRFPNQPERLRAFDAIARRARALRTFGDAYGYLLVATGRAEVMVDPVMAPWDAAFAIPVIEAAGGVVADFHGKQGPRFQGLIATNRALGAPIHAALRDVGRGGA